MPRKQRTVIKNADPQYHSNLPRKSEQPVQEPDAPEAPKTQTKPIVDERPAKRPQPAKQAARTAAPKEETQPVPKPATPKTRDATREVHLTAAITRKHGAAIEKLVAKGIDRKVPIRLAGRKAVQLFEPKRKFIEKPEADRLPIRDGYQTTKRINVDLIDHLRTENDPYGLSSDTAMLRGQFEPLFWKCLDEVLQELSQK